MDEMTKTCLYALATGEIYAALQLADYLQDTNHPRWERISQMARVCQETLSWLELLATVQLMREVITGSDEEANDAVFAFERLVNHVA